MYLLSTKPRPQGRTKRSFTNEGSDFLRSLRKRVGRVAFDSFMAVQGDVSLMFVIDSTGSMRDEIQAAKNIAKDIINYNRKVPIKEYILSPFNDPYPCKKNRNLSRHPGESQLFTLLSKFCKFCKFFHRKNGKKIIGLFGLPVWIPYIDLIP